MAYFRYYDGNTQLPIYRSSSIKEHFSIEDLAKVLLVKPIPSNKICSQQPLRVQHNCCFIVDLKQLDDHLDIRADDNGVWRRNGSPSAFVSIHDGTVMRRSKLHQFPNHYKITRYYYNHTSSPDFHTIKLLVCYNWFF